MRTVCPLSLLTILLVPCLSGCNSESKDDTPADAKHPVEPRPDAPQRVVFPESLFVDDREVTAFVRQALDQCAAGDYDAFRRLWTAKQDPMSRDEFEEGWAAVQTITVRALEKVMLAAEDDSKSAETVYALFVEVALDPERPAGKRQPLREIVLMLTRENEAWRIARPPKAMREWIKSRASQPADGTASPDSQLGPQTDRPAPASVQP